MNRYPHNVATADPIAIFAMQCARALRRPSPMPDERQQMIRDFQSATVVDEIWAERARRTLTELTERK